MTPESTPIRVRSLTSVLNGNEPGDFVRSLFDAGYDRFYVKVPKGFRVSIFERDPYPPLYQLHVGIKRPGQDFLARARAQPQVRYVQLNRSQLGDLLEYSPITLHELSGAALVSALDRDGLPPVEFTYQDGMPGRLLPVDAGVADKVLTEFHPRPDAPMVVKTLNRL